MSTSNKDVVANIAEIEIKYEKLINKYTNEKIVFNQKDLIADLKISLSLFNDALSHESKKKLKPTPAKLFLKKRTITEGNLQYPKIKSAMLFQLAKIDGEAKKLVIDVFNESAKTKEQLLTLLTKFQAKSSQVSNLELYNNRCDFIELYLSVPNHAKLFSLSEIEEIFKAQGEKQSVRALRVASTSDALRKEFVDKFTLEFSKYSSYYQATANLSVDELTFLLSDAGAKKIFLTPLTMYKPALRVVSSWSDKSLTWLVDELITLSTTSHEIASKVINEIFKILVDTKSELFLEQFKRAEILNLIANGQVEAFPYKANVATTINVLTLLVKDESFLNKATPSVAHKLCRMASLEQLQVLMANENLKQGFMNYNHPTKSDHAVYWLLGPSTKLDSSRPDALKLKEQTVKIQKAKYLIKNHPDALNVLSPESILDLASNKEYGLNLSAEMVTKLLAREECWQTHKTFGSKSLNGKSLLNLSDKMFKSFIQYDDFKEAWLRTMVKDVKWDRLGQGFFAKKTPATIMTARQIFKEKGDKSLSKQELQEVLELFKTASNNSHTYLCGLIDLRDQQTHDFYSQAAEIPAAVEPSETVDSDLIY